MPLNGPVRRPQRRTHLDASVVPVEGALLARAEALEHLVAEFARSGAAENDAMPEFVMVKEMLAAEFRALAEEMHWW